MGLQAYTQCLWRTQTPPCVKLWTDVSRLLAAPTVKLDTDPCSCLRTRTVFLAKAKMFASAYLSTAVAGINHDGGHHGRAVQLMKDFISRELACDRSIAL